MLTTLKIFWAEVFRKPLNSYLFGDRRISTEVVNEPVVVVCSASHILVLSYQNWQIRGHDISSCATMEIDPQIGRLENVQMTQNVFGDMYLYKHIENTIRWLLYVYAFGH